MRGDYGLEGAAEKLIWGLGKRRLRWFDKPLRGSVGLAMKAGAGIGDDLGEGGVRAFGDLRLGIQHLGKPQPERGGGFVISVAP